MRVERTAVISVRPEVDGWTVVTLAGTERVNAEGEGSRLVPLDPEMAAEFEDRGSSFVVRSTAEGIEQDLDPATAQDVAEALVADLSFVEPG